MKCAKFQNLIVRDNSLFRTKTLNFHKKQSNFQKSCLILFLTAKESNCTTPNYFKPKWFRQNLIVTPIKSLLSDEMIDCLVIYEAFLAQKYNLNK